MKSSAASTAQSAKDSASKAAGKTAEAARSATDTAKDAASSAADTAKSAAAGASAVATDAAQKAKSGAASAKEAAETAADKADAVAESAAQKASEAKAVATGGQDHDGEPDGADEGTKPETLSAPRGGTADNLKEIKGVGPKLEQMLNGMGFYHFDQIANWTADEIAWVDANLTGFKGRVTRDDWVAQAKILAGGGDTEFSKRVDKGDVY
jgi:predicted flap endonuclease-1-like 5' DNA nuclease